MISPTLVANVRGAHGARGDAWLAELPALVDACARRWKLEVGVPFADLSYSYVAPVLHGATRAVLKLGVPRSELSSEIAALAAFRSAGAVRLLDADPERGALLLERLEPGTPLSTLADDEEATAIAARLLRELWREPPAAHEFPTLTVWARAFARLRAQHQGTSGPLPEALVAEAESIFAASSARDARLLHGDLHHANVLAAGSGSWRAIDPKGVVGDPAFDVGPWLRNPRGLSRRADLREVLDRRLDVLSRELALDREHLRRAGLAFGMLSACWSVEAHDADVESTLTIARALERAGRASG